MNSIFFSVTQQNINTYPLIVKPFCSGIIHHHLFYILLCIVYFMTSLVRIMRQDVQMYFVMTNASFSFFGFHDLYSGLA